MTKSGEISPTAAFGVGDAGQGPERRRLIGPGIAIGVLSAAALAFLFYLLYGRHVAADAKERLGFLPAVNACCNAATVVLILRGLRAIRRGHVMRHRQSMLGAFAASTIFLIGYITYHAVHGDTLFPGRGWVRPVYFSILISHITLSAVALPMVLTTFYLALTRRFAVHKKWARFTYPVWLYVSATGVLVFLFLKVYTSA